MNDRLARSCGLLALACCLGAPAGAQVIEGDAIGEDNLADPRYYGVDFVSAGPAGDFLSSISYDISADLDGVFDLDGVTNFGGALEPVVQLSSLVGITAADISWSFTGNQPNVITASFAPGSFGLGDSFRFACETDLFVADPCKGGNFATGGAIFSATFEQGPTLSGSFAQLSSEVAIATVDYSNCALSLALPERSVQAGESLSVQIALVHKAAWTSETSFGALVTDPDGKVILNWTSRPQVLQTGKTLSLRPSLVIPPGAKPGVYRVGVGIGEMRQGLALRSMEFLVEPRQPEQGPEGKVLGLGKQQ